MKRSKQIVLVLLFIIGLTIVRIPQASHAASQAPDSRVLLVYDSKNVTSNRSDVVAGMQRLLISAGLNVDIKNLHDYKAGTLTNQRYRGVVTLINWPQAALTNRAFVKDRANYHGIKLHVGPNLDADELAGLHSTAVTLHQQQLIGELPAEQLKQLMPFTSKTAVLDRVPANAQIIGKLTTQDNQRTQYPYGVKVGMDGFLPYFDGRGLSLLIAQKMAAQLFRLHQKAQAPLLLITEVTPFNHLKILKSLAKQLQEKDIPFAVSAVSVAKNTDLKAFEQYMSALRTVEENGGSVIMQVPAMGDPGRSGGPLLRSFMSSMLTNMAKENVIPIAVSAPTYWNNDAILRRYALDDSRTIVQLKDPPVQPYAQRDDHAKSYQHTYMAVPFDSFSSNHYGTSLNRSNPTFAVPTAITFPMPTSERRLTSVVRDISHFNFSWANPLAINNQIRIDTVSVGVKDGQLLLNNRVVNPEDYHALKKAKPAKPQLSAVNRFFRFQGDFMWVFFAVTLTAMTVLLILGRRVYKAMYRR